MTVITARGKGRRWALLAVAVAALAASGATAATAATTGGAGNGGKALSADSASKATSRANVQPDTTLPEQPNLAGAFVAAGPTRLLDTRNGLGENGQVKKVGQVPLLLDVSQVSGNPSVTPTAVVLNVTVTGSTAASFLAVYPGGQNPPATSNLNYTAGKTIANLVTVPVGYDGKVAFYNAKGTTDVIADLAGYYTVDKAAATYVPDGPARILDTRSGTGTGGVKAPVGPGKNISLEVTGVAGIPTTNITAVVLNVTATNTTSAGFLTVYPDGTSVPNASNLNFTAGATVPNLVVAKVGADGKVDFHNAGGTTDVIADLTGYFVSNAPQKGGALQSPDVPARLLDTRSGIGTGGVKAPVGTNKNISLKVTGVAGIPATNVTAVVLNVTATNTTSSGFLTVYPDGTSVPNASNLNFTAGATVPNLVVAKVGADGKVDFHNAGGTTDVIADVFGYYLAGDKLGVSSLAFASSTVDASTGGAVVNVNWTVTDSDPAATQTGGEIVIRQQGSGPDTYIGQSRVIEFLSTQDLSPNGAALVSGDAASSTYSYTFAVPQYAGATTAKWAVSLVSVFESATQEKLVLSGSALSGFGNVLTATEQVSTVTPIYDTLELSNDGRPAYLYDGANAVVQYGIGMQDWQSGFWQGTLQLSGPGGKTFSSSFADLTDDAQLAWPCQHSINDPFCYVSVDIPAGTAAGTWSVSSVSLTNNAGQTKTYSGLDAAPVTVTSNSVVSAGGFSAAPNPVNNWAHSAPFQVAMRVSGSHDGVSSIQVYFANVGGLCIQNSTTPTLAANGTYSVPVTMEQANNGASTCTVNGIVVTDGAGDAAIYGSYLGLSDPGLVVKTVPDTTPPTATAAQLNITTIAQSQISNWSFVAYVQVNDLTAPIDSDNTVLYDSAGNVVGSEGGGDPSVLSGQEVLNIPVPYGLAVGTYHVGFTITDAGGLSASYGMPGTPPVPGGPLTLTITAG